jgi:hypothetical protein
VTETRGALTDRLIPKPWGPRFRAIRRRRRNGTQSRLGCGDSRAGGTASLGISPPTVLCQNSAAHAVLSLFVKELDDDAPALILN